MMKFLSYAQLLKNFYLISIVSMLTLVSACGGGEEEEEEETQRFTLSVSKTGEGAITSISGGINCGSDCSEVYDEGSSISLSATPVAGMQFSGWSGACSGITSCTVAMNGNQTISAVFEVIVTEFDLTVSVQGSGSVASSPSGISCGNACQASYASGSSVQLTAAAAAGSEFVSWQGACNGSDACNINMNQNQQVTATFQTVGTETDALTVSVTGNGSVTSNPVGISCGNDCSEDFNSGTSVTLAATATSGSEFVSWQGACNGSGACNVNMNQNQQVTATFQTIAIETNTLTVTVTGNGSVSSNPVGISCGSDCTEDYNNGTSVTLSATAESGFVFAGWSGDCSGSASCSVLMNTNRSTTAQFVEESAENFDLTVTSGSNGRVTSSPAGIDCGSDCSESYLDGTDVSLTAVPDSGFQLAAWSGSCSGAGSCSLNMSQNRSVTATFEEVSTDKVTLNVTTTSGGTVTSSPSGISCGADCTEDYDLNTAVNLIATPNSGFKLQSWSGACSGNVTCELTMTEELSVTATFVEDTNTDGELTIEDMGLHEVDFGDVFTYQPTINGDATICRKDLAHDDVKVDSETGQITWDTNSLNFGRGFYVRIKCSNSSESAYASMVVHVDKSGTSRLRVAGENGVSQYIGTSGQNMTGGDTIVIPDGEYPVSVSRDESYENAFKSTAPTDGSSDQYSTVMARTPGGATINGEAHDGIGKQKNAFQLSSNNYVAIVGFVVKNVQRESFTTSGGNNNKLLVDFVGAQGAGTWGQACDSFSSAGAGQCSNAGMRINSGTPLIQSSYDWGHNRYGIMTRSTSGSVTRRSFVRLDEHKGDQPYGGFSNYCDTLHLSQDNTVFDSLAIAAPHYKNYAGLEAYPATGCENDASTLKTSGLLAVNNNLSLSLMDSKAGPTHEWEYVVSYDSEGTCTPQTNRCGTWLLQSDKAVDVTNSFFGKARAFGGSTSPSVAFGNNINLNAGVLLNDVTGKTDTAEQPSYLPENQLYFRGKSDTFHGDTGYDTVTTSRRWPIPGEDIIAKNMRAYHNPTALKVGGGTVDINGDRGATATGESMSEYFWGYINDRIPPLVVRVKDKGAIHRVAWEHLTGSKRSTVTGWKVICVSSGNNLLATLGVNTLVFDDDSACNQYGVKASYASGDSEIAYTESPE
jgi:hypothetical protein